MRFRAVIFDLGGVVLPSPFAAFRAYERRHGLPHRFVSEVVLAGGEDGAWSRFERGELGPEAFAAAFEAECAAAGHPVVVADLLAEMGTGSGASPDAARDPDPQMVAAITTIRDRGLQTAALTNNWVGSDDDPAPGPTPLARSLGALFDTIVESAVEGLRKPDPRIYALTCARLGVGAHESVFLDDIGANLKPARAMGMTTIKVESPGRAITELATVLGFPLTERADHTGPR